MREWGAWVVVDNSCVVVVVIIYAINFKQYLTSWSSQLYPCVSMCMLVSVCCCV